MCQVPNKFVCKTLPHPDPNQKQANTTTTISSSTTTKQARIIFKYAGFVTHTHTRTHAHTHARTHAHTHERMNAVQT